MSDSCLFDDGPEDLDEYPLSVRFTTRRAILNAITQAKITDGTFNPKPIICRIPVRTIPIDYDLNLRKAG